MASKQQVELRPGFLPAILLIALSFAVYANVLNGDFIWDDHLQIAKNTNIRTLSNIPRAFTSSLWSFVYSKEDGHNANYDRYYRPFQTIFYIAGYQLGGLSPFVYHLINVMLHSAASLLVYLLCLELGLASAMSLMAGAIFAVHPVHTEAVSWIAGVGDVSCAVFYFAGLVAFQRYLKHAKPAWVGLSSVCFLGAMFSKEMGITFPLVCFLMIWRLPKKKRPDFKAMASIAATFIVVAGVYAAFRITAVGISAPAAAHDPATVFDWITLGVSVLGQHVRYVIAPYPLYAYHLVPLHFDDRVFSTFMYGLEISAVVILAWVLRRRFSAAPFWLAIFGIMLIPVLYFKGISGGFLFAERYLYIPSIAAVILAGFLLSRLSRKQAIFAGCSVIGVFAFMTIQRNQDWRNEERLFRSTLRFQPEAVHIWVNLAEFYLPRMDDMRAQESLSEALKHITDRRFSQSAYDQYRVYLGLGTLAFRQSRPIEAVDYLQKALKINPEGDGAYTQLGGVLINWGGRNDDAMLLLKKAIQISAVNEAARDYMGVALLNQKRYDEAIAYFREALQLNPELESAKQHLEMALKAQNQR